MLSLISYIERVFTFVTLTTERGISMLNKGCVSSHLEGRALFALLKNQKLLI